MREIYKPKLKKWIKAKELHELSAKEREVYDHCVRNRNSLNSNTMLCINFWQERAKRNREKEFVEIDVIKEYPPESLTKKRRDIVLWELLFPDEEIQEMREQQEKSYHTTPQVQQFEQETQHVQSSMFKHHALNI